MSPLTHQDRLHLEEAIAIAFNPPTGWRGRALLLLDEGDSPAQGVERAARACQDRICLAPPGRRHPRAHDLTDEASRSGIEGWIGCMLQSGGMRLSVRQPVGGPRIDLAIEQRSQRASQQPVRKCAQCPHCPFDARSEISLI